MTILFMILFGRWGIGEMGWYGNNKHFRERIRKREFKYLPIMLAIDFAILYVYFC
jgi:uncharacterized membrane protein YsdA (DUF1294 family)